MRSFLFVKAYAVRGAARAFVTPAGPNRRRTGGVYHDRAAAARPPGEPARFGLTVCPLWLTILLVVC